MRIQKKTKLRKLIKKSVGNTGSLDIVEFYIDGTWDIVSCGSSNANAIARRSLGSFLSPPMGYIDGDDKIITANFAEIEGI